MKSFFSFFIQLLRKLLSFFGVKKANSISPKQMHNTQHEVGAVYGNTNHDANQRPAPKTYKEAHDRSWEFLYKIVDFIQKKFSKEDLMQVVDIGTTLFRSGMVYVHQVVFNPEAAENANQERIAASSTPGMKKKDSGR